MLRMLSPDEVARLLQRLPDWELQDVGIRKTFRFEDLCQALLFLNAVRYLADMNHHRPDVELNENDSSVCLRLHSRIAGGLTQQDLAMALHIEALMD